MRITMKSQMQEKGTQTLWRKESKARKIYSDEERRDSSNKPKNIG